MKRIIAFVVMAVLLNLVFSFTASAEGLYWQMVKELTASALPELINKVEECKAEKGQARSICAAEINDKLLVFNFLAKWERIELLPIGKNAKSSVVTTEPLLTHLNTVMPSLCLWERLKIKHLPKLLHKVEQCKVQKGQAQEFCKKELAEDILISNIALSRVGIEILPIGQ